MDDVTDTLAGQIGRFALVDEETVNEIYIWGESVMTRQEQKMVKELRGAIDQNLKSVSKLYGFKTVSGCAYKVIDGFLYEVYISAPPIKRGTAINADVSVKPCAIDDAFWEVYHMQEIAQKKPLSFHITAAHAPYPHTIEKMEIPVRSMAEVCEALDEALRLSDMRIEQHRNCCSTIADFKAELAGEASPTDRLNTVLCEIVEGNYQSALLLSEKELEIDRHALFVKVTDHGLKSIYEYVKEFCKERM